MMADESKLCRICEKPFDENDDFPLFDETIHERCWETAHQCAVDSAKRALSVALKLEEGKQSNSRLSSFMDLVDGYVHDAILDCYERFMYRNNRTDTANLRKAVEEMMNRYRREAKERKNDAYWRGAADACGNILDLPEMKLFLKEQQ